MYIYLKLSKLIISFLICKGLPIPLQKDSMYQLKKRKEAVKLSTLYNELRPYQAQEAKLHNQVHIVIHCAINLWVGLVCIKVSLIGDETIDL